MTTTNPTPQQVFEAIRDHGVPVRLCSGWNTVGRSWTADGGGLFGATVHHTATASATGSTGAPSLNWCLTAYSKPAANMLIGRSRNDVYLMSAGSCYHSGNGGPAAGITSKVGNNGHYRLFGIEIDDPGKSRSSLTDDQIEMTGRVLAALRDLCGWPKERIGTHTCWTDGCHGYNPSGPSQYCGRKDDTLGDGWGTTSSPVNYNAPFWRAKSDLYVGGGSPPPPVTTTDEYQGEDMIVYQGSTPYLLSGGKLVRLDTNTANNMRASKPPIPAANWTQAAFDAAVKAYGEPVT